MAHKIDEAYEKAVASGLLPGVCVIAGDKNGNTIYSKSLGKASLKDDRADDFTPSTICAMASVTKLMTSVAALQAVESGKVQLDQDIRPLLPGIGKYGVITGFDDEKNSAILKPDDTPITLRMLLCHTSGHEYDWLSPLLGKWRASRNEQPWSGPTVADKCTLPLVFAPGTGFAYGGGHDWAGKVVEVVTGMTLDEFMSRNIWSQLGIEGEVSFYPKTKPGMKDRMADLSTLNEKSEPPAVDAPTFDILFGGTDCLGGGGGFGSANAYYTFLSAVFRRDSKLLTEESYKELFRPQLEEKAEQALNDYFHLSPAHTQFLALGVPQEVRKTWSLAGVIIKDGVEGRLKKNTTMWGGVPSMVWFMDHEAGVCGAAFCQILPPMSPPVIALHAKFQGHILEISGEA
ncbi:hypothetical protein Daus18300_007393 [Diaporthe australafricana]|uniref:Beta-lactamase-related domain-containing protein n=1 Tax=Diaporthe australafricana TaxID=127596 RepID=A0ABR3WNG4_9PEZI